MNIVLFGPPGAGKGTQARMLEASHKFSIISTGEILREEIKSGSLIGLEVKDTVESGRFPSEDIVLKIFEERLKQHQGKGLVLDGIPRTLYQAQMVDVIFERLGLSLDAVIQIAVNDEELITRLSKRFICKSCNTSYTPELPLKEEGICDNCGGKDFVRRSDDTPEAIRTRLDVYDEQTKPLLQYYSEMNRLQMVNGMKSVDEVNAQIENLLYPKDVEKTNC